MMRVDDADATRGWILLCVEDDDGRPAWRVCNVRCGSAEDAGTLFYVRRETGRSLGVDLAAVRSGAGRKAGTGQSDDGPWGGEPKRARGDVFGSPACDSRSRKKAAGESGSCCGRRRRDWIAAFSAGGAPTAGPRRAEEVRGRDHALRSAGHGWIGDNIPGREGCDRAGAGVERRKVGTRSATRCAFEQ